MDFPSWFGVTEFYAILGTVWFALIVHLFVNLFRVKKELNVRRWIDKFRLWRAKRKLWKEEGKPYKPLEKCIGVFRMKIVEFIKEYWFQILLFSIISFLTFLYFYLGSIYNPDFWTPRNTTDSYWFQQLLNTI